MEGTEKKTKYTNIEDGGGKEKKKMMSDKTCYAAIDIGSNAVRLLIKRLNENEQLDNKRLEKVLLLRVPLRLGWDVFSHGMVSENKVKKLRRLMKAFRLLMKVYDVTEYRACATSAMRDASNGKDVIKVIKRESNIDIEVIDGVEEARIIYSNHVECLEDRTGNYIYVDVGGGSTEINFLVNGNLVQSLSYDIGTVRLLSGTVQEETWDKMKSDLAVLTADYPQVNIIGSGGNINKLYRMAGKDSRNLQRISIEQLRDIYQKLLPLTPQQRMQQYGFKADRADVIVPAAEIFLTIAQVVKSEYVHVPVIGLADGIIDSLYKEDAK